MDMAQDLPRVVASFDRERHIAGFSPTRHAAQSLAICAVLMAGSLWLARSAQPIDWLFLPAAFLVANFVEWTFHKHPMHHPKKFPPGARVLYLNHTMIHHRAFLHDRMEIRSPRELGLILMPWYTMILLFVLGSPAALIAGYLRGPGMIGIFYVLGILYYLFYEVQHALYHTSDETRRKLGLLHNRVFNFLRDHHAHHHRLDRMSKVNFNVTVPIADWLMGTRERPALTADAATTASEWEGGMDEEERRAAAER